MNTFSFYNPVKLHFGKGALQELGKELPTYGNRVLVVYGGGSIKSNGIYDEVTAALGKLNVTVFELVASNQTHALKRLVKV